MGLITHLSGMDSLPVHLLLAASSVVIYFVACAPKLHAGFPVAGLNGDEGVGKIEKARRSWLENGRGIMEEGTKKFSGAFQVVTTAGPKIVLPNKFADEIRNNPHMNFQAAISAEFFGTYPGFEPFGAMDSLDVTTQTVRGRLTQSLNFITEELAEETSAAITELFGEPETWTEVMYKPLLLQLVARVSSRVFVGEELCTNEEWLNYSVQYAVQAFAASDALRKWPFWLRPFVHRFLPECQKLRHDLACVRKIITPVVNKRREENRQSRDAGGARSKVADTIGWMDEAAKGKKYDIATAQLGLALAAIHTTTELVSSIIGDLCANPQWFEPLREEMVSCVKQHGWTKKALLEMKFTDSLMKESQRHHFGDVAAMHRITTDSIKLSDGTTIPKGAFTMVGLEKMQDSTLFPDPNDYRPRRFLEMRQQPGQENKWQFVTTSPEHLAFGHGKHACPGRFFAANEIKIILIHLVTKYEWKLTAEGLKDDNFKGADVSTDPTAKALIKLREQDLLM